MAREIQTFLLCDPCMEWDEARTIDGVAEHTIKLDGFKPRILAVCERHAKEIVQPFLDLIDSLPTTDAAGPASTPPPDEQQTCLVCEKTLKNLQTLQGHLRNQHDMVWSSYRTEYLGQPASPPRKSSAGLDQDQLAFEDPNYEIPDEFKCTVPGCDAVYDPREYTMPKQAIGLHRAKVHKIKGKAK